MNVVQTGDGKFIEVQGTAEGAPFDRAALNALLDLAAVGIKELNRMQREIVGPLGKGGLVIRHLLLATTNAGKLREIRDVLAGLDIDVSTLADFPAIDEAEEHGATFAENARAKALHYAAAPGGWWWRKIRASRSTRSTARPACNRPGSPPRRRPAIPRSSR